MAAPAPIVKPAETAPLKESWVDAYNPDGALVQIPAGEAANAAKSGYTIAGVVDTPEQEFSYETVKAGARGALKGLSVGLAEPFEVAGQNLVGGLFGASGAGDRYHEESKRLEAAHPTATTVGEVAGVVGGTIATGAIGGALGAAAQGGSRAASVGKGLLSLSPLGAVEGAGLAAEQLAGRAVSGLATRGALGRAAATGVELGARGAVEGSLVSAITELNEELLGKPELSAEKIFTAAADGATSGALFGAGLGATGSLVKSGAQGLRGLTVDVIAKNADKLQALADDQRWRALDPLKKYTQQAEARVPGGTKGVSQALKKHDILPSDIATAAREGTLDVISGKLDDAVTKVGQELGDLTAASAARISIGHIDDVLEKTIAPLRKNAGFESVVRSLESYRGSLGSKLVPEWEGFARQIGKGDLRKIAGKAAEEVTVSLQDALAQRKALDQLVYREAKSLDPNMRVAFLRDVRKDFEGLIVNSFDDAAKAGGNPQATAKLLELKRDYQALSLAQEAAADATSRMQTNRNLSWSDYISGGVGSNIGTAIGGAVLGAPGAALGGLAGGALGAAVNRFGRERGNAIAAAALDKAAEFARAQQAIKLVDAQVAKAVRGIVEGRVEKAMPSGGSPYRQLPASQTSSTKPLKARYDEARRELETIQSNNQTLVSRAMVPSAAMPKVSQALGVTAMRAAAYMQSQAPTPIQQPALGQAMPMRASDPDMHAFLQKYEVAKNPMVALRAFQNGRITQGMANTLRVVSPEMFAQLQSESLKLVIDKQAAGKPIPYNARQRMSLLLGILTDPSQDPKMIAVLQSNLTPKEEPGPGGGSPRPPGGKTKLNTGASMSHFDKLEGP